MGRSGGSGWQRRGTMGRTAAGERGLARAGTVHGPRATTGGSVRGRSGDGAPVAYRTRAAGKGTVNSRKVLYRRIRFPAFLQVGLFSPPAFEISFVG